MNPVVRAVLRSPARRLLSGGLVLITVTGRNSGREFTIPAGYAPTESGIRIRVGRPEEKRWWRNLTGSGAPVGVLLAGRSHTGIAVARPDERDGVVVEVAFDLE